MNLDRRVAHLKLLDVGVDRDEVDLGDPGVHHPVERVQPGAADADDTDHRKVGRCVACALEAGRVVRNRLEPARRRPLLLRLVLLMVLVLLVLLVLLVRRLGRRRGWRRSDRLGVFLAALAPLRGLGGPEQLRERALTHACAFSRH